MDEDTKAPVADEQAVTRKTEKHGYRTAGVNDGATEKDTLGFGPYVRAMATFLTNPRTKGPLTISIEGEWGSGKSSFMLQLKKLLEGDEDRRIQSAAKLWNETRNPKPPLKEPIVIEFNAWRHDKAEELWAAFAMEILRSLSRELGIFNRWWTHVRLLKVRFDWGQGWWDVVRVVTPALVLMAIAVGLPIVVGADKVMQGLVGDKPAATIWQAVRPLLLGDRIGYSLLYVAAVVGLFALLKNFFGNPFAADLSKHLRSPDYRAKSGFIERFHQDFSKILDRYVPQDRKVVCFIDDLDRCEVPKAADLMQAINLMLPNDERMIFLLGMDRQKVAAGLTVKFKDLIPFLPEPGQQTGAKPAPEKSGTAPAGGLWFGHDFIEKFVQIAYALPRPAPDNLDGFLNELVGSGAPERESAKKDFRRLPRWLRKLTRLWRWRRKGKTTHPDEEGAPVDGLPDVTQGDVAGIVEETTEKQQKELVRLVELEESENDPEILKELVGVLAPAFDYNPRRLKQFVNLFRLNLATAAATRLLYAEEGSEEQGIRLEQLGKFVALGIRWPDLIPWLERDPKNRLKDLCEKACADGDWEVPIRVSRPGRLRELLRAGCLGEDGQIDDGRKARWGLEGVDVQTLLAVSPAAPETRPSVEGSVGSETLKSSAEDASAAMIDSAKYVLIPAGRFQMGAVPGNEAAQDAEKPAHGVEITKAFHLKKTPVTVGEYKHFAKDAGREMLEPPMFNQGWKKENHPIGDVSWEDATAYCEWAGGRLPTEAEWEYAARGGKERLKYPWGDEISEKHANYGSNVGGTSVVGSYPANGFGLYDMAGNVLEWCSDWYGEDYYSQSRQKDPQGPSSGKWRVLRGGAWSLNPEVLRTSDRGGFPPGRRGSAVGFRCVREVISP